MATIGSISVAFDAETSGLTSGVEVAAASLASIGRAVDELRSKLSGLSSLSVSLAVDTSAVEAASKSVDSLKAKAASSSASVTVAADAAAVTTAEAAVESLGQTVAQTGASAVQARSSLGGLVVTTASVVIAAQQAAQRYGEFRDAFVGVVGASTGARNAAEALRVVFQGLAGDTDALKTVFSGIKAGIEGAVAGFLSVENVNGLLQASLGGVLRLFGATDAAVVASTQVIANIVTQQVAHAASHRLVQRSLQALNTAYDSGADALARFLTQTSAGRATALGLAQAIGAVAPVALRIDAAIREAVNSVQRFLTSGQLMGAVSAAVGSAFDGIASAAAGLVSRVSSLDTGFAGLALRLSLVSQGLLGALPSLAQVSAGIQSAVSGLLRFAPAAGTVSAILGTVTNGFNLVSVAASRTSGFLDFSQAVAQTAATTAAVGALGGAATAAAGGSGILSGAVAGATASLAGLASTFPLVAAASTIAAVATGKVADALQHVGNNAEMLGNLSDRFGQPVQEIEKLKIAAEQSGVALTSVVKAQQTLSQNISKVKVGNLGTAQTREAKAALTQLGVTVQDVRSTKPEELFVKIAKELSGVEDATKRTQIAMDLFGRTGPQILPLLKNLEELNQDIGRLGGTISDLDFERFLDVDQSFDRLATASGALRDDLAIPFTRMQEAWNNASAEIIGGLAPLVGAFGELVADISTPFAVVLEVIGRVAGTLLRVGAAAAKVATAFLPFAAVAAIFETAGDVFNDLWSAVEAVVAAFESFASAVEEALRPTAETIVATGEVAVDLLNTLTNFAGLGDVFGETTASVIGLGVAILAVTTSTKVFSAVMATAAARAAVSAAVTAAAWVAAGAAIFVSLAVTAVAGIAAYVAATLAATATTIASAVAMHIAWLFALGPIGLVIGAIELLIVGVAAVLVFGEAVASWFASWGKGAAEIDGATASATELAAAVASAEAAAGGLEAGEFEAFKQSIQGARNEMSELSIRAAQLGTAGADAVSAASEEFNELQRSLGEGKISMEEFNSESARIADSLKEGLDAIAEGSPEETLKRNLELFKQLDDAAKSAAKSVREIGAGVQIGDKFFPRSNEVKERAKQYADEYSDALDAIKRKLASGEFQVELDQRRQQNEQDFAAGAIDEETFRRTQRELDTTTAQEQASIAAEEVQRELDRKNAKLKVELDFADGIRKSLETAFLSPVELFQKELDKIRTNVDLTDEEKALAEQDLRRNARENLIGKTAVEQFSDRERDINQGEAAGLITAEEAANELRKNADSLAKALGIPVNPANQMETAISELDAALKAGKISVEQHAEGLKAAERSFLESLGIKPAAEELDSDRLGELRRQRDAGNIDDAQFERGRQALEDDIVGQSAASRIAEERRRIAAGVESGAVSRGRGEAAMRSLDADRRSAAGIDGTAAQQLQLGIDKVNDAFGVAGMTLQQVQAALSPQDFAEYQKALKQNADSVRQSLGVNKSVGQTLREAEERLAQAVQDGVISQEESTKALKKQRDDLLASLGVTKTPSQEAKDAVRRLQEAFDEGAITAGEFTRGWTQATNNLNQALGIPLDPILQLRERMGELGDALAAGQITQEEFARGQEEARRAMLPGGEEESPVKVFRRSMEEVNRAAEEGLITDEDAEQRRQVLRADLQDNLRPALDNLQQDRRQVGASDVRSKAGVDTFFRILQGRDNPSLRAQLEIARNTRILADAQAQPEAAAVIAQLAAR